MRRDTWCSSNIERDALEYYNEKIEQLRFKIKEEEKAQKMWNSGIAIIVFQSRQISIRLSQQTYFNEKLLNVQCLSRLST